MTAQETLPITSESVIAKRQRRKFGPKHIAGWGPGAVITAEVRYDDDCGNGHNSFSITAEIVTPESRRRGDIQAGGCLHEEIAQAFPELAPFLKWHLVSSDGPMHYPGNVTYHASNRDHWGCLKGEPHQWEERIRFGDSPISHSLKKRLGDFIKARHGTGEFQIVAFEHPDNAKPGAYKFTPNYSFVGLGERWHEAPFHDLRTAEEWQAALRGPVHFDRTPCAFGEGKAREFGHARSCAVWPEATDEQLSLPKAELEALLNARLPALLADFRGAVESFGFTW